jgi:AcrR family transcriptional regulator
LESGSNTIHPEDVATRQRLLDAATELFNQKGYAATTVREIVEAAGVTKPVLYYYFKNKEGLYAELMTGAMAEFDALLERAESEPGSARERIERLAGNTMALFRAYVPVVRIMYAMYYGPPQGAPFFDFDRVHFRFQELIKRLLVEGRERGEFRFDRTEDAMWAVIGAVNIAQEVQLCHPDMALGDREFKRVLDIVMRGLGAEPSAPGRRTIPKKSKGGTP